MQQQRKIAISIFLLLYNNRPIHCVKKHNKAPKHITNKVYHY